MINITYIEASTGHRWKVSEWPDRTNQPNISVEFIAVYQYDKSRAVNQALSGPHRKDIIVLQECSVYFPGDIETYQEMFVGWLDQIEQQGSTPIVVTIVPPTSSMGIIQDIKNLIKHHLLGRPKQIDQVLLFNDWLRELAFKRKIGLLDLEAIVRVSDTERVMNTAYNSGDGIHPNAYAYSLFDQEFQNLVASIDITH